MSVSPVIASVTVPFIVCATTLCGKNGVKSLKVQEVEFADFIERMDKYEFNAAFEIIWGKIQDLNKRIDEEKPWSLAKTDPEKAVEVLTSLSQDLINLCPYLAIFIPDTAEQIEALNL